MNKQTQNKIKGFGIALSLVLGFMLFSGSAVEIKAQSRGDVRDARQDGYREGLEEGREDARERRRFNPYSKNDYRRAGGEDSQRERRAYRNRFLQGYSQGYRRAGNRINGNMRQTAIQTRNVRIGRALYRETYRIVYRRNGTARTQLISRVRIR